MVDVGVSEAEHETQHHSVLRDEGKRKEGKGRTK
jgi:hypothetical protein